MHGSDMLNGTLICLNSLIVQGGIPGWVEASGGYSCPLDG